MWTLISDIIWHLLSSMFYRIDSHPNSPTTQIPNFSFFQVVHKKKKEPFSHIVPTNLKNSQNEQSLSLN
jgi:hypothetical protein